MKIDGYLKVVVTGIFILGSWAVTTYAANSYLGWKRQQVLPVVFCEQVGFSDSSFRPVGSSSFSGSWKKAEVTPVVLCEKVGFSDSSFRPVGSSSFSGSWKKAEVKPWIKVRYNSATGTFE